jgi:acyl dehydratase
MQTITSPSDIPGLVDRHLGYSRYIDVTQDRIDLFADATGDHQWIHVDPERAATGPFGATIAHGYLTLSLGPELLHDVLSWENIRMGVNYGLNKVRFPAPVPVGSRVRLGAVLLGSEAVADGGVQVRLELTFEIEGGSKPACVAELLLRYFFDQGAS